jgi:hypothetical protein
VNEASAISELVWIFLCRFMNQFVTLAGSVLAIAGLVHEAISARQADPYYLSGQSLVLIVAYSLLLFVVNLRKFKKIKLNIGRFDFDEHNLASSRTFFPAKDRAGEIFNVLKIKALDVLPPKQN